jgi:hypothetical protein
LPGRRASILPATATNSTCSIYVTDLTSYQAGNTEHIGNFDIANVELGAPDGELIGLPYAFQWTPRPATATDNYELDLSGQGGSAPSTLWDSLGYTDSFVLEALPWGFETGVPYAWNVWIDDPFGGSGISYETHAVTFSPAGMRFAPAELKGRQRRLEAGALVRSPSPARRHPDYELLKEYK